MQFPIANLLYSFSLGGFGGLCLGCMSLNFINNNVGFPLANSLLGSVALPSFDNKNLARDLVPTQKE